MNVGVVTDFNIDSIRDLMVVQLVDVVRKTQEAIDDITGIEYHWEPISKSDRSSDLVLPPEKKKVWRVFQLKGVWTYDYTPEALGVPPFTTIAWIMNHIAQTGDMYLYCLKSRKPEGIDRKWDDLPVYSDCERIRRYIFQGLDDTAEYLKSIPATKVKNELNKLSPAPWGEMRPAYRNVWGGIIAHTLEHVAQISNIKHIIRFGY